MGDEPVIITRSLAIGYPGKGREAVRIASGLDLSLVPGRMIGLLGPNGSGKSTLLRTLGGMHSSLEGEVEVDGRSLSAHTPQTLARKIGFVLAEPLRTPYLDAWTLVALGRSPYTGWLGRTSPEDRQKVDEALRMTGAEHLAARKVEELSDGERQKVMIARAMAQDTPVVLLDEPTAHLDLPTRVEILRMLRQLAREQNKAILLSTHELDLALKVADRLWLMGDEFSMGTPEDLVLNGALEKAFEGPGFLLDQQTGTFRIPAPQEGIDITLSGEGPAALWTERALEREGFLVRMTDKDPKIIIRPNAEKWMWEVAGHAAPLSSVEEVLEVLKREQA